MRENILSAKKGGFALVELLLTIAVIAILVALIAPQVARADVGDGYSLISLKVTNNFGTNITSGYPTNGNGSNLLGGMVSIANVDNFDIDVQGFLVNTNSTNNAKEIDFALVGALVSGGTPQIGTNTNAWSANTIITNQNDFVTNNWMIFRAPLPASYSNWYHWHTNVSAPSIYQNMSHVGIGYLSNNLDANCFISNSPAGTNGGDVFRIGKKVKAIRYP